MVEKLESIVGSGSKLPLTSKVMVDGQSLLEVVDRIRASVPEDIKDAHQIIEKREQVINQALLEARRVKTSADQESKSRVQDSEIVKMAQKRADEVMAEAQRRAEKIVSEAQRQAEAMRRESDQYALDVLSRLESQLSALLNSARRGIEQIEVTKAA
ncbi:MAG: hypothetical protein HYX97_04940 [Chloroflexi bacterium]|nr:hypothetical protein [Chloroflexota bacterium]